MSIRDYATVVLRKRSDCPCNWVFSAFAQGLSYFMDIQKAINRPECVSSGGYRSFRFVFPSLAYLLYEGGLSFQDNQWFASVHEYWTGSWELYFVIMAFFLANSMEKILTMIITHFTNV